MKHYDKWRVLHWPEGSSKPFVTVDKRLSTFSFQLMVFWSVQKLPDFNGFNSDKCGLKQKRLSAGSRWADSSWVLLCGWVKKSPFPLFIKRQNISPSCIVQQGSCLNFHCICEISTEPHLQRWFYSATRFQPHGAPLCSSVTSSPFLPLRLPKLLSSLPDMLLSQLCKGSFSFFSFQLKYCLLQGFPLDYFYLKEMSSSTRY